jgi:4-carboxymuconolactone decarboxylase
MPRVPYKEDAALPINIFRALANSGPMTKGFSSLGSRILNETELDTRIRELVINAISVKLRAPYEWSHHAKWLLDNGGSAEELEALKAGNFDAFSPLERACLTYAYKVEDTSVTDEDVAGLREAGLDDRQIVELTILAGFYGMTARFLLAMGVEVDEGNPDNFGLPQGGVLQGPPSVKEN